MPTNVPPKSLVPLFIVEILKSDSSEQHPLMQVDIIAILHERYNLSVERKTIARDLHNLLEAGYNIKKAKKGYYLENDCAFSDGELRLLIDSVLFSRHINPTHAQELINKISHLGNVDFECYINKIIPTKSLTRDLSSSLFYNIELLTEAIDNRYAVSFIYNAYDTDLKLHPLWNEKIIVVPQQLVVANNHYYLVASYINTDRLVNFRIEKISEIAVLETKVNNLANFSLSADELDSYLLARPYMYVGNAESIVIQIDNIAIDDFIDNFGIDFEMLEHKTHSVAISLTANVSDVIDWACKNAYFSEILDPPSAREAMQLTAETLKNKYI